MTNNKKIIFGFTGLMASGKGTAAKYFEEKYSASTYRFSTMLRDVLNRLHLEHTRDNLIKLSEVLRTGFGEDILAKTIAKDAEKDSGAIVIIEGIRRRADILYLEQLPHFVLVEIAADIMVRYNRLTQRRENPDDATKTFEQFSEDHKRSTEITIPEVALLAKEHIDNNGNEEHLHQQLDLLLKKYQQTS
jgi:dephospho-CoA kinase